MRTKSKSWDDSHCTGSSLCLECSSQDIFKAPHLLQDIWNYYLPTLIWNFNLFLNTPDPTLLLLFCITSLPILGNFLICYRFLFIVHLFLSPSHSNVSSIRVWIFVRFVCWCISKKFLVHSRLPRILVEWNFTIVRIMINLTVLNSAQRISIDGEDSR